MLLYTKTQIISTIFIDPTPAIQKAEEPLLLKLSVLDYMTPIQGVNVSVSLSQGIWQHSTVLYDDGFHSDGLANDGIYANYLYVYPDISNNLILDSTFDLVYIVEAIPLSIYRTNRRSITLDLESENQYPNVTRKLSNGWNWVGFPRLISDNAGNLIDCTTISLEPYLSTALSQSGYASYENHWLYYGLQYLDSKEGYKLRIRDIDTIKLYEMGTLVDITSEYPIREGWNWLTYPCSPTVYPEEALANILDDIDYVLAQKWSMKKENGVWIHDNNSLRPVIKYGDSIEVRAIRNASLFWNGARPREETKPLEAEYYTFEDKPNYETLMVESIDGNPSFVEIGVYQDDTCIGARVFEGYPIQILAYSEPAQSDSTELEFRIWADDKREIVLKTASVSGGKELSQESTLYPELGAFRHVRLKQDNDTIPAVFALEGNYPNPFNPSTTLRFSIPNDGKVKLSVYNLKGQKVVDIVDGTLAAGSHQAIWHGKDSQGRSVASGIYFTRLEQGKSSKVHKMVLMK